MIAIGDYPPVDEEDRNLINETIRELYRILEEGGFILHLTVREHYMKCGKKGCKSHANPPVLHGPYLDWTRKISGKTRTVRLNREHAEMVEAWIKRMRKVENILSEIEKISIQAAGRKIKK